MGRHAIENHPKQAEVLSFIINFKSDNDGCAPSTREIQRACGISSGSQVRKFIHALEKDTAITVRGTRVICVNCGKWEME